MMRFEKWLPDFIQLNHKDNTFTAIAKNGFSGMVSGIIIGGSLVLTSAVIGRTIQIVKEGSDKNEG